MSILITGGLGFIGSHFILDWFSKTNEPLINVDKLTYAACFKNLNSLPKDKPYQFIQSDINNQACIQNLLTQYQIRAIIHFAAESHVDRSIIDPKSFVETNIIGTFHLLETTRNYWRQLPADLKKTFRFIYISTDEIYGAVMPGESAFTEMQPHQPNNPYAATKAASNNLARAYFQTYQLPIMTTISSNNYGPFQHSEKLIPLCIQKALSGSPIPIYGDGLQIRDWLYVGDHCRAIRTVLKLGELGEVYNVGGIQEKTNIDLVTFICELLDELSPRVDKKSYKTQITFVTDRLGHDRRYALDASKIALKLDWKPMETFASGMYKTVQWYLDKHLSQS